VFFDFDKADLDAVARQVIGAIIEDWGGEANRLSLVGHTDRAGTAAYNQRLSEGRVQIVTDALVAEGVVGGRISGAGKGESETAVPTADGVREPRNRRVVVTVE
jgi:OOP family OmpA-OmpF porin